MRSKQVLTLADVKKIAAAAEAEAVANKWPVTIAIVDDGGNLLWLPFHWLASFGAQQLGKPAVLCLKLCYFCF